METGAAVAGMLLVEKTSWKDEKIQEMVRREGFRKVEETDDYVVLLPATTVLQDEDMTINDENVQHPDIAGYQSSEEEDINVITTSAPDIVDFNPYDWDTDAYRAGPGSAAASDQGAENAKDLTQPGGVLYAAEWELSGDRKLEDVGLNCLRLDAELLSEVSKPSTISFRGGKKQVKKVTISLGAFSITQEPTSARADMRRVVHRADIMLTPIGAWGEDNKCLFLKVVPNATSAVTPAVTIQKSRNLSMTVSPGQIHNPVQFVASGMLASTCTVKQQIWWAVPENMSATWVWSIYAYNDGRPFNPAKTDLMRLRAGRLSQSLLDQLLVQPLTQPTFQVSPDDVKATWTVDTEQLMNVSELEFATTVTLYTTAFRRISLLAGCFKMLQEKSDPQHIAIYHGKMNVSIAP